MENNICANCKYFIKEKPIDNYGTCKRLSVDYSGMMVNSDVPFDIVIIDKTSDGYLNDELFVSEKFGCIHFEK